jgi:hypothetical protein
MIAKGELIAWTPSGKSVLTLVSGARLLVWSGSKLHPIGPGSCEIASSEPERSMLSVWEQQLISPQSLAALRSSRQHDFVIPVAQHNAQPKPPSHIVRATMARQLNFIRIGDGLSTATIIATSLVCVETGKNPGSPQMICSR